MHAAAAVMIVVVEAYMLVVLAYMKKELDRSMNGPYQRHSSFYLVVASWVEQIDRVVAAAVVVASKVDARMLVVGLAPCS